MISVICTIYNTRKYLKKCIESILDQTYNDIQIVLIDDGSTDGSAEILDDYAKRDTRIKLIHQQNKGHSEARNVGLLASEGEYVYFVDSDDYIHPRTLEILYNNMITYDADVSVGNVSRRVPLDVSNNRCRAFSNMEALHVIVDAVKVHYMNSTFLPMCATWNKIFKKSIFDNIKFPTGHVHDDNFTVHKIYYKAERIVLTSAITYFYTRNDNGIVAKGLYDDDMILAYEDRIKFFQDHSLNELIPLTYQRYEEVLYRTYMQKKDPALIPKMEALRNSYYDCRIPEEIKQFQTIGLYFETLCFLNGMTSWMYNFINGLNSEYRIVIFTKRTDDRIRKKFRGLAEIITIEDGKRYQCDILLNNSPLCDTPSCFDYKKMYCMIHCDYANHEDRGKMHFDKYQNYIAVSKIAADNMCREFGVRCDYVEGLFMRDCPKPRKVLHLVSATRFSKEKGFDIFRKFATLLKDNGVLFEWRIYTDTDIIAHVTRMPYPEMVKCGGVDTKDLMAYMADADYVVQLSQVEGFGLAVHEALMVGTPVIASDIPVFRKYIQNGYNGYLIPKDMKGVDIDQICNNIPTGFSYENQFFDMKKKWERILTESR